MQFKNLEAHIFSTKKKQLLDGDNHRYQDECGHKVM